jgi:nitrate/nitrite-specific signal transduction histidine kinase
MRRRFDKLGGQCQVESSLGKGCRVRFVMAYPPSPFPSL